MRPPAGLRRCQSWRSGKVTRILAGDATLAERLPHLRGPSVSPLGRLQPSGGETGDKDRLANVQRLLLSRKNLHRGGEVAGDGSPLRASGDRSRRMVQAWINILAGVRMIT
jgi:hypothetical protein